MQNASLPTNNNPFESFSKMLPWLRGLIVGAFLLGGWQASLQMQLNANSAAISIIQADRTQSDREWRIWRDDITSRMVRMETKTDQLVEQLQRRGNNQ